MVDKRREADKVITWRNVAGAVITLLILILSGVIAGVYNDVQRIDVLEVRIEQAAASKGWMKKMQEEIRDLQKTVWKNHPE